MTLFQEMNLPEALQLSLKAMNFSQPTPVQTESIPVALAKKDLIACAQTGTGKTGAFGIPMIAQLIEDPNKHALVLAPTRELALQIHEVMIRLTAFVPRIKTALLIGGLPMQKQIRMLSLHPRVIVATPGRLVDHLKQGLLRLNSCSFLVLDEADRMLDMGFAPQLKEIVRHLPTQRQTLLFSATLPSSIMKLASQYLQNPEHISITSTEQSKPKIQHSVIETTGEHKNDVLLDQLTSRLGSIIIFAKTKHRTDRLAKYLQRYGHSVARIHGDRSQSQRESALQGFRNGTFRILVATDIAARGIDVPHIAHVINYDLPQAPEDYVHRIGRTARAGATGEALCLLIPEEHMQWRRIVRLYLKHDAHLDSNWGQAHAPQRSSGMIPTITRKPTSGLSSSRHTGDGPIIRPLVR